MTILRCDRNVLLVEGTEERLVIPELVEKATGILWGDRRAKEHPVEIHMCGGDREVLNRKRVNALLKTPHLEAIGLVIDANGAAAQRWQRVRDRFEHSFPSLPDSIPPEGLFALNAAGLRLGVWIMPDNQRTGMLETLLCDLIRQDQMPVFEHAKQATAQAQAIPRHSRMLI